MADELETPAKRIQGRKILADALKTFMFSMSEGLSNRGRANQSTGAGAALAAPFKMQQMAEAQRLQEEQQRVQADAIRRAAATGDFEAMMKVINESQGRTQAPTVPLTVPGAQAVDPRAQGQVFQGDTQMGPQQLPPFQVKMPGGQTQQVPQQSEQDVTRILRQRADDEQQAQLRGVAPAAPPQKRAPINVQGRGLFDLEAGAFIPGSEPVEEPKVDPALVDAISKSPSRYHDLPPSIQAGLIPELEKRGVKIPKPERQVDPTLQEIRQFQLEQLRSGQLSPAKFNQAQRLADDFVAQSKDFLVRRRSYDTLVTAGKNPSAAGDLSIIFAYMKLLDPPSTVREGEQALAANAAGVPDRVRNIYNRVLTGERLAPAQRQDFINQARSQYAAALDEHKDREKVYTKRAEAQQIPADAVIYDMTSSLYEPAAKVGDTKKFPNGKTGRWDGHGWEMVK